MIQSDVISALKYWDSVGVLHFEKNDKNDYTVEFFETFTKKEYQISYVDDEVDIDSKKKKFDTLHTYYTKSDFTTTMNGNEKIKQLFTLSSQLLNKTLSTNDMNVIFMFYDYLKFPPEVIFSLLEYCISIGKNNMRYIEKVAISWADAEINTPAKANAFIRTKNKENAMLNK
jgi:DnaD/phage-associated family protein